MAPQTVFICYAPDDRAIAERICQELESAGTGCWIAPRDVEPGCNYSDQIQAGIEAARAMVVIMSAHANAAPFVGRELERAANKGKEIFLFLMEETRWPCSGIGPSIHWIEAWTPPLEARVETLVAAVRQQLGQP